MMEVQDFNPEIHRFRQSTNPPLILKWSNINCSSDSTIEMAAMGTDMCNQPTAIRLFNEFGQRQTSAIVGWEECHQQFVIGKDATVKTNCLITDSWNLGHLLATGNIKLEEKETKKKKVVHCFEFLLGYLLKRLKKFVERQIGFTQDHGFSSTVITIPFCLSSTQRIQIKDGAKLAGFNDVYIVNESSAAAFGSQWSDTLLILIESGVWSRKEKQINNRVDAFVYSCTGLIKRVEMLSHSNNLDSRNYTKKEISFFQKLFTKKDVTRDSSVEMENPDETVVQAVAENAILQSKKTLVNILVICIPYTETWDGILQNVGRRFGALPRNDNMHILAGALLLGTEPEKIKDNVKDLLSLDIKRKVTVAFSNRLAAQKASLPLKFEFEGIFDNEVYQVNELDQNFLIGKIIFRNLESDKKVQIFAEVDHEGIVEFKDCKIISKYCWCRRSFTFKLWKSKTNDVEVNTSSGDYTGFSWTSETPKLTEEKFSEIAKQLSALSYFSDNVLKPIGSKNSSGETSKLAGFGRTVQRIATEIVNEVCNKFQKYFHKK